MPVSARWARGTRLSSFITQPVPPWKNPEDGRQVAAIVEKCPIQRSPPGFGLCNLAEISPHSSRPISDIVGFWRVTALFQNGEYFCGATWALEPGPDPTPRPEPGPFRADARTGHRQVIEGQTESEDRSPCCFAVERLVIVRAVASGWPVEVAEGLNCYGQMRVASLGYLEAEP
jgi:hypothetical protein